MKKFRLMATITLIFTVCISVLAWEIRYENGEGDVRIPISSSALGNKKVIDTSVAECVYEHYVYDPYKKRSEIKDWILEIGAKNSRYGVYGTYQRDSAMTADYSVTGINQKEFDVLCNQYGSSLDELLRFGDKQKIEVHERILMDSYAYEEDVPTIEWRFLSGADEEVCGYQCKKAEAEFRGRTWTAWYAEAIQIDNGPWKFGGLPGLILKVEDSKKEHIFEVIQIRKSNKEILAKVSSSEIKTDRKSFNRMMREFCMDAGSFLAGNPLAPSALVNNQKKRRMFYNPIELD